VPERGLSARVRDLVADFREVGSREGWAVGGMMGRAARLGFEGEFTPREALVAGLLDPRLTPRDLEGCVSKRRLLRLQEGLNPHPFTNLTEDKALFYPYCAALGLPIPKLFGLLGSPSGEAFTPASGLALLARLPTEFVVKPALGVYGLGVQVLRRGPAGFLGRGAPTSGEALLDGLFHDATWNRWIFQERLAPHPDLSALSGAPSLQTVRLVTQVDRSGAGRSMHALLKIVVGQNAIDNYHNGETGNLFGHVDLETGSIGPVLGPGPRGLGLRSHDRHPETGESFSGFVVPRWREALALVERAAQAFLPLRAIGWDVAVTGSGVFLIEGNAFFDPPGNEFALYGLTRRESPAGVLLEALRGS
jgi:hypothetical protein